MIVEPTEWRRQLVSIPWLFETYDIEETAVFQAMHKFKDAQWIHRKRERNQSLVDVGYIMKVQEIRAEIWNECHDLYYTLSEHLADGKMASILDREYGGGYNSWYKFLNFELFCRVDSKPMFDLTIADRLLNFRDTTTRIIKEMEAN